VVETLGSFGTTVTGSLVKCASDERHDTDVRCDEPMCCVNVIVNGNVVSIGFYLLPTYGTEHRKDLLSTQMSTRIQRDRHAPEVLVPCLPHHAPSVCGSCSLACALAMAPPSRLRLLLRPGPPVDAARDCGSSLQSIAINVIELPGPPVDCDCGSYAAASAPQTCEPAVPRAVRG